MGGEILSQVLQVFRRPFAISVRTKVHQPRHASSVYHPEVGVRGRVELEVQVQNVLGTGQVW